MELKAFFWGLLATSSLIIGGALAMRINLSNKILGIIMAFGAGTLISAVAYELVYESVKTAPMSGFPAFGFFAGALTFFFTDRFIEKIGAKDRKHIGAAHSSNLMVPMVLAIILDGIPESIVIGLGMFEGGKISLTMFVAVFISNLPEAIAGSTGMKAGGIPKGKVFLLWLLIAVVCALAALAGFSLFSGVSVGWLAFIQSFAGGAILLMLANSMIPEAYEHGGKLAGLFTVVGFFISVSMVILERM